MKANWLSDFIAELTAPGRLAANVKKVVIYYRSRGTWCCGLTDKIEIAALDKVITAGVGYCKIGASKAYYFPLPDVDAVVHVSFDVFPRKSTLTSVLENVEKIKENSRHRFDALHDSLTGCKNRKSFELDFFNAISVLGKVHSLGGTLLSQGKLSSVNLVTVDIDFFKRINDGRGHEYGDMVLRGFAWCLQDYCGEMMEQSPGVSFELYRLGGEEFNILICGEIDEKYLIETVEGLRGVVEREIIPSDHQSRIFDQPGVLIPPMSERKITASFGVSRVVGFVLATDIHAVVGKLKGQADKALYSAKGSGRNCVRYFPDILKKYGRVLEHDESAGVVAIDIGLEAGVVKGREFFVVPERYTGETSYVIDDGRSRRTLGKYPRVKTAKIVAFDVQSEISFCSVSEKRDGVQVISGAFLEAIPLGLFGGLSGLHDYSELPKEIEDRQALRLWISGADESRRRMVAIRFAKIRDVELKHGSVKANEILAGAVAAAKRVFPAPIKVVQTEIGNFGVAFTCDPDVVDELMSNVTDLLNELCYEVVDFSLGIFDEESIGEVEDGDFSLDKSASYDYATIAAASAAANSWRRFDSAAPLSVISESYSAGEYEKLLADYGRFKDLGIVGASFENHAGLAYFLDGKGELACSCFRAAVEFADEPVVRSNLGISNFYLGRTIEAFDNLRLALNANGGVHPNENSAALFAVAGLDAHIARNDPTLREVESIFQSALGQDELTFLRRGQFEAAKDRLTVLLAAE
ncbi:GGDEF domain-containing protein [Stenotrophomonas sp. PS02300]|uniref:GGDEF domain-containing protein n=1 Tax=Stenotrophomonas sp. PS02300 TaxID=2991426 RepID=UPI002499F5EF|nr:GGDEF domain-containing protein [Stenotrophomonas sp. PS02300]